MNGAALQRLFSQSWHILPEAMEGLILRAMEEEEQGGPSGRAQAREARPTVDAWGDPIAQMEITDAGVAIIPVQGPLFKGATPSEKYYFGLASYEDIAADLDSAVNQFAQTILLDIDSPGGTVAGLEELSAKIDELSGQVDIFSFNRGVTASAAEYLSVGAVARFAVPSSVNGSIGTILQTVDLTKMLEMFGVKVETFASGKYKGMGSPYRSLSDDQRQFLRGMVQNLGQEFKDRMMLYRPDMKPEQMEGQTFFGKEALEIGLVDELVMGRGEVLGAIS